MSKFVFLGAPGVGKGTFAVLIASKLNLAAVGAGDLVRREVDRQTDVGMQLKAYSVAGLLVPDEVICNMVRKRLRRPDAHRGFILEGFPRTVQQARWLDQEFRVDRVVNIDMPEEVSVRKILGRRVCKACKRSYNQASVCEDGFDMPAILPDFDGCEQGERCPRQLHSRADDTEEVVRRRMDIHRQESGPLVEYYQHTGVLKQFQVRKGVADQEALLQTMLKGILPAGSSLTGSGSPLRSVHENEETGRQKRFASPRRHSSSPSSR